MRVKAAEGVQVPREENPRTYIGQEPVEIEPTGYYIRRLADGDLVEVPAARPTKTPAAAPAAGDKQGAGS